MFESLSSAVRREVSGERALEAVRALAGFHRVQASPGYDEAAAWMARQLEPLGLEIEVEHVPGDGRTRALGVPMPRGWSCTRAEAALVGAAGREPLCDYAAEPLSLVLRSASARGRYPLVAVADGSQDAHYDGIDVRGAVVLAAGPVHRVHELAVVERGAAGLLTDGRRLLPPVREESDERDAIPYTSFWWVGDQPRGWGFVVSPERGTRLRERLRVGEPLALEVEIDAREFDTRIPLLSARLPGSGPGDVLLLAHLCHPRPSANDNASGAAAVLETARVLAGLRHRGELPPGPRGVRFLWVPELTGTCAWLAADPDRAARTLAALNLDMVGEAQDRCGSTLLVEHPPCFAASFASDLLLRVRAEALDWVPTYSGPGHYSLTRVAEVPYAGGSDHAVLIDPAIGVPCPMLIQWPDRFYHSSHDTPDQTDPRSLALAARCAATYAGFLAAAGPDQAEWLLGVVGRAARRRCLTALDRLDAPRAAAAERWRGRTALESCRRLDPGAVAVREAVEAFERFCDAEGVAGEDPGVPAADAKRRGATPRRRVGAPLDFLRHRLPGYAQLPREAREAFLRFEASVPGGSAALDVAWFACDGRRTVDEIARLVWLECGVALGADRAASGGPGLSEFFEWTSRLGVSEWVTGEEGAWSSSTPDTATR